MLSIFFFKYYGIAFVILPGIAGGLAKKLGGKMDMPSIGRKGEPLEVKGIVRTISEGRYVARGPMFTGLTMNMGRTVVLDTGGLEFVIAENTHEPFDLEMFRSVGIEPTEKTYILLKSRVHYRADFLPIAKAVVECDGVGVTSSDYGRFKFRKVRRPIFPLDGETTFQL